jgi:hypothetical protein
MESLRTFGFHLSYMLSLGVIAYGAAMLKGWAIPRAAFGAGSFSARRRKTTGTALMLGQIVFLAMLASGMTPLQSIGVFAGTVSLAYFVGWLTDL